MDMPSLIDLTLEGRKVRQHGPWPRAAVDASRLDICGERTGAWTLEPARPLGRARNGAHGDHGWTDRGNRGRQPGLPRPHFSFRRQASPAGTCGWNAPSTTCSDCSRTARPMPAPGSITTAGACAFRWEIASTRCRRRRPTASSPAEGDGLHQIAVGPVHAGIIEPGHFRFTASGETVVRLEQRLGYAHKGIDGLMSGASLARGVQLAGRTSGDSTVAYAYAFSRCGRGRSGSRRA